MSTVDDTQLKAVTIFHQREPWCRPVVSYLARYEDTLPYVLLSTVGKKSWDLVVARYNQHHVNTTGRLNYYNLFWARRCYLLVCFARCVATL